MSTSEAPSPSNLPSNLPSDSPQDPASTSTAPSTAAERLLTLNTHFRASVEDGEADWIGDLRGEARTAFEAQGWPTRRLEAWKGTNLAALEKLPFATRADVEGRPVVVSGQGAPEFRFLDGRLETANATATRLPTGARLLSLAEARRQEPTLLANRLGSLADPKTHALVALQTTFLDDGAVLVLDPGVELETPIRLRFDVSAAAPGEANASFPRLLVLAGEGSRATLHLEHTSVSNTSDTPGEGAPDGVNPSTTAPTPGLTAFIAEFELGARAAVECVQLQKEGAERVHFTSTHARLGDAARFDSHVFSLGTGLTRSELDVRLAGPGAETRMRGFFLGRERGHVDHFTTADHEAAQCTSDEEYRGVLGDRSKGVFRGRVVVRPGAQKTDARQSNPNLLLSDHATIDAKPQLEIYADDVKASHGSTTGQLDPDAVFFLRARGIDQDEARLMLTRSFAHAIVDGIGDATLRADVADEVDVALDALLSQNSSDSDGKDGPR